MIANYVTQIIAYASEEQQGETYELRLAAIEGASELIANVDSKVLVDLLDECFFIFIFICL